MNILRKILLLTILSTLIFINIYALPPDTSYTIRKLQENIDKIIKNNNFKKVDCGIKIYSVDKSQVLYSLNENEPMSPASTMKIVTVATALSKLNSKSLFKTALLSDKKPKNNIIDGDLYIKGFGNPIFNDNNLMELVNNLKDMGIKEIKGDIIADESYFDEKYSRTSWANGDEIDEEESPISALSLNRNYFTVHIKGAAVKNKPPVIEVFPKITCVKIINKAKTANLGKRRRGAISLSFDMTNKLITITVGGQIRTNSAVYRSALVRKPALYTALILKDFLKQNDIKVKGNVRIGKTIGIKNELTKHEMTLDSIVKITNKHSDNFLADYLLKVLGAELKGTPGQSKFGREALFSFLKEYGVDAEKLQIIDGSGLSKKNKLSASALTNILSKITKKKQLFDRFYCTLPIAGVDGTMKWRLKETSAEGNARAKTGTLSTVSSLAGYVRTKDNELISFAIMMNEFRRGIRKFRFYQDEIVALLSEFSRKNS
jgi:serine-type D-Ala-D-Ala carboxypeptidase/endopeptidase (penicillin-binding protein 4)